MNPYFIKGFQDTMTKQAIKAGPTGMTLAAMLGSTLADPGVKDLAAEVEMRRAENDAKRKIVTTRDRLRMQAQDAGSADFIRRNQHQLADISRQLAAGGGL